jgi:Putative beta-barrel porin-2, OmpL-like. bbp2
MFAMSASAQTIALHGWIDGYYSSNPAHPQPRLNFFSGIGTTAHRANQPALNVAAFEIVREPKPVGFHLILIGGDSADVVHSGERHRDRHTIRNLFQATVSYNVPVGRGLALEAGVYPSHIGYEGFFTKDNWNYTRSTLGELAPYYQTGIKASYAWSDRWSGQLHVIRGWQTISDTGSDPSFGTQIAYNDARLSASFNTFAGPERNLADLVATWKLTSNVSLGTSLDVGADDDAHWGGIATYARYALNDRHAFALRAERFRDPHAGISGFEQTLTEGTFTYEHRPSAHFILKFEGRRDHSSAAVFNGSRNQRLAVASVVATY